MTTFHMERIVRQTGASKRDREKPEKQSVASLRPREASVPWRNMDPCDGCCQEI